MRYVLILFTTLLALTAGYTQKNKKTPVVAAAQNERQTPLIGETGLEWRCIGPFRGGRSAAVTGVPGKPNLFYFGATGGGVWRTQDGGRSWDCISDGFFGGSIGAVEVAPGDPNVIWVGGGEVTVRGNVSAGTGVWRSFDAGRTWHSAGLKRSRHIPRLRVHPDNPDCAYAAVLGDLFKDDSERGVFRTRDGGRTWEKVLYVNESVGAVDLCFDPTNPRILYATTWRVRRTPHSLSSGGEGSGLFKSIDGGDSWTEITRNEGLPSDTLGIIGVAVSPVNPDRVWAIIESKTGGVFRSDDGGKKWVKLNDDRNLRQRAWYYTRIYADPSDAETVYVMNVAYHKSKDGGRTFQSKYAPHGDHHDFWIAPENPQRMIIGDDGGAQITYDGGETWSTYHNQPTAQFYRVTTDNAFPFRIYGAQQDNTSVRIRHRSEGGAITERDWEPTAGGESGHIAPHPLDPEIVFGGEYHGYLSRIDHRNKTQRAVNVWPEDNMGHGAIDAKYRFQWNFPLFFSRHNPKVLYAASNHLHRSDDEGQTWTTISPDLTTNDTTRQLSSGGPITQDNTSVEYYCTIFAAAESPRVAGLIWTGSDDGLIHLTRNGGANWENVTPPDLPRWAMINSIEPDPHSAGGCYFAATNYKSGDYQPLIFKTNNYGKTWTKIVEGIEPEHFTRTVRVDEKYAGLLYAGTEQGVYVSLDDGGHWQKLQLNLPLVPVTDLAWKENKLIAATQGRSFWMIDDLTPIQNLKTESEPMTVTSMARMFDIADTWRMSGGASKGSKFSGENHPNGVMVHFWLSQKPTEKDTIRLAFYDGNGRLVKAFSTHDKNKLTVKPGGNRFVWNMRVPDAEKFDGMVLWSYDLEGPKVVPGRYQAKLSAWGNVYVKNFEIKPDPRSGVTLDDYQQQFDFVQSIGDKLTQMHRVIADIRTVRAQMNALLPQIGQDSALNALRVQIRQTDSIMTEIEKALYQTQNRSPQDPLNFPVKLNDKLANLMGLNVSGDFPPTRQSIEVRDYLFEQADAELTRWTAIKNTRIPEINRLFHALQLDVIVPTKRE